MCGTETRNIRDIATISTRRLNPGESRIPHKQNLPGVTLSMTVAAQHRRRLFMDGKLDTREAGHPQSRP